MKKRNRIKWIAAVCLTALLLVLAGCGGSDGAGDAVKDGGGSSGTGASAEQASDPAKVGEETAGQLIQLLSEGDVGPGNEWSIIGIARSSLSEEAEAQALFTEYEESLRLAVKRTKGVLDPDRPTDNARAAIALKVIGGDPSDVEGYDLLAQLEDADAVKDQGINAEIWALNAAACCGRELKAQETYIEDILGMQLEDGSITYDGQTADVDIAAMAMQALAPFAGGNQQIAEALAAARGWLASQQNTGGDYGNSESTSQVVMAVASLGEDPAKAKDFAKGSTLLDGLMLYRCADGFSHLHGDEMDVMATEQALCAIDSALLAAQGEKLF